jgi:hypothetical protein
MLACPDTGRYGFIPAPVTQSERAHVIFEFHVPSYTLEVKSFYMRIDHGSSLRNRVAGFL